jgi:hypothetical protein
MDQPSPSETNQEPKHTMKSIALTILAVLSLGVTRLFAHGGVELGPNGGRILEFSKNETMHGEVTVKNGKFHIAVLDKDMKPVKVDKQSLTATGGNREKPEKLAVEKVEGGFVLPVVKDGDWLIVQFKEDAKAKAVTARMQYDTGECEKCKAPEWLCKCKPEKDEKKDEKKK